MVEGLESVKYVSGYFCHTCRKLLRGDYGTKIAHCRDPVHLSNLANGGQKVNFRFFLRFRFQASTRVFRMILSFKTRILFSSITKKNTNVSLLKETILTSQ